MIKVEVRLYGALKERLQSVEADRPLVLELGDETTLEQLIDILAIPGEDVIVTLVNGIAKGRDHRLSEGEVVDVFPPLIGG